MNIRRSVFGVVVVSGRIYVVGGYDGYIFLSIVECYLLVINSWNFVFLMGIFRSVVGVIELNGKIYVIGGYNGLFIFSIVEIYDS